MVIYRNLSLKSPQFPREPLEIFEGLCLHGHNSSSRIFFDIIRKLDIGILIQITTDSWGCGRVDGMGEAGPYGAVEGVEGLGSCMGPSLMCSFVREHPGEA